MAKVREKTEKIADSKKQEKWQWLTVADGVGEEWREDEVKDSGERAHLSLGRAVVDAGETYSEANARWDCHARGN